MDRRTMARRRLLIASLVTALASCALVLMEIVFHEGHVAELRTHVCDRYYATAIVLAAALPVTTWKWFRATKAPPVITVEDLRER